MRTLNGSIVVLAMLLTVSCGTQSQEPPENGAGSGGGVQPGGQDATGITGAFLTPAHFEADAQVSGVEVANVVSTINNAFIVQNTEDANQGGSAPAPDCAVVQDSVEMQDGVLVINYGADDSRCGTSSKNTILKVFAAAACSTTDISSKTSQTAGEIVGTDNWRFCPEDEEQYIFLNMLYYEAAQDEQGTVEILIKGGWMSDEGNACLYSAKNGRMSADGCNYHLKAIGAASQGDVAGEPFIIALNSFKLKNVSGNVGDYLYDTGEMEISINEWNGYLTYQKDGKASYVMSDGVETYAGDYGTQRSYYYSRNMGKSPVRATMGAASTSFLKRNKF